VGLSDEIRDRVARRRGRWTYRALEEPVPAPAGAAVPDPAPKASIESAKPAGKTAQSGRVVVNDPAETKPDSEVAVATTTTPEFDRAVPPGLQVAAAWSWRVLLVVALIALLGWLARYLSEVIVPVAVAILLAALLSPVASRLRGWGLPRAAATAATVLGGLALIAGALILIGAQIAGQAATLSTNVVQGFNQLMDYLRNGPLPISDSWLNSSDWGDRIQSFLSNSQSTIATYAAEIGAQVGHFLAGFAITMFTLFYFIYDGRGIFTFLLNFFPRSSRERVDEAARKGWRSLSSFVRATILVALSDAIGVLIVALILGVPVAPALAALVFIGAFVPLIGAVVSGFVAVVVALVALGWVQALIMLAGLVLVMQIEGHVLQPFLLGRAVKLHPLAVLLAIAVGIIVGGIVGALFAVPLLAFTKSFIQYLAGAAEPVPVRPRWPPIRRPI
jgi:putative heme transporter